MWRRGTQRTRSQGEQGNATKIDHYHGRAGGRARARHHRRPDTTWLGRQRADPGVRGIQTAAGDLGNRENRVASTKSTHFPHRLLTLSEDTFARLIASYRAVPGTLVRHAYESVTHQQERTL